MALKKNDNFIKIPINMIWIPADEEDARVKGTSPWTNLDNYKTLKPKAGVYIFADNKLDVKYIGKAGGQRMVVESDDHNIERLFEVHNAMYRKKDTGATQVKALYTYRDSQALKLEGELIKKYSPPNNGVDLLNS